MSILKSLISSPTPTPPKMIVYSPHGVGKTTFAAKAQAVITDMENGASAIPGAIRTPYIDKYTDVKEFLTELLQETDPPLVLAIDTLDWLIQRIIEYVTIDLDSKNAGNMCNTIGTAHGGYFKARDIVMNIIHRELIPMLNQLNQRGVAIILLAHAANVDLKTPEGYDIRMAAPDLPQWVAPVFLEWVDCVLYGYIANGERWMRTERTNIIEAKNRYSLPPEMPLDWQVLMASITKKEN